MMWWASGWFGMVFGPLVMILGLAVAIALALALTRWSGGANAGQTQSSPPETALDILKKRFASGDIDKNEYQERRRLLNE